MLGRKHRTRPTLIGQGLPTPLLGSLVATAGHGLLDTKPSTHHQMYLPTRYLTDAEFKAMEVVDMGDPRAVDACRYRTVGTTPFRWRSRQGQWLMHDPGPPTPTEHGDYQVYVVGHKTEEGQKLWPKQEPAPAKAGDLMVSAAAGGALPPGPRHKRKKPKKRITHRGTKATNRTQPKRKRKRK